MENDMDLQAREDNLIRAARRLQDAIETIQQPRTDFEIEHFVVGARQTPGRQWAQAILELQLKLFAIQRARIEKRRAELDILGLREKLEGAIGRDAERLELDIEEKETDLVELELARLGAVREAETLLTILGKLPHYTREQLEAEEPIYWRRRLSEQSLLDGNRMAIRQMLTKIGDEYQALPEEALNVLGLLMEER
jgi:hypothetical protein